MKTQNFLTLLHEMDCAAMADYSVVNHHVNGLTYLCLFRNEKLTVKLYFIDPERLSRENEPLVEGDYLVVPHAHRYAFESTVLDGELKHVRFQEHPGSDFERFIYTPEDRKREKFGATDLQASFETHTPGSEYFCTTDDIHTLLVPEKPVLLGLVQYSDTRRFSAVYLEKDKQMFYPRSIQMGELTAAALRKKALDILS